MHIFGAKLAGEGLLVANDISASRAKALLKNLEIFGIRNSFVTNAYPAKLAEQFAGAFDKILVDAPCSGEGMFRKDLANARVWSLEKVKECAKTQHEIIRQAVSMLRPGGLLLYSTCTFSPEEDVYKRQVPGFEYAPDKLIVAAANGLAAAGAEPVAFQISAVLPTEYEEGRLKADMKACAEMADAEHAQIIGGHTQISSGVIAPMYLSLIHI